MVVLKACGFQTPMNVAWYENVLYDENSCLESDITLFQIKMKFCIEHVSKSSGRLGQLIVGDTEKLLRTPLLLQTTKSGSIPHLSREVFDYVTTDPQMLQLSLTTMLRMADSLSKFSGDGGISDYIGFKHFPTMFVLHDPSETLQGGHNDKDIVPIFTRHGKKQISAKRYMNLIECFTPDIYEGLCDADTNRTSSKKRVLKSIDRTVNFMNYCFERHCSSEILSSRTLFAPVVGGYCAHARSKSIQHTNKVGAANFGGYMLEGFHSYGLNALDVQENELYSIVTHCMKELVPDKPRMMPGAYSPLVTLELIRLGIDMFDTSYPYCATKYFKALTFSFDFKREPSKELTFLPFLDLTDENHNLHHYLQFFETIRNCITEDKLSDLIRLIKFQHSENEINYHVHENLKPMAAYREKNKEDEGISL